MTRLNLQLLLATLIHATVAVVASAQDWRAPQVDEWRPFPSIVAPGSLYGQVDALFWTQDSQLEGQPLIVDANTGQTFLSTFELDSNFAPGLRATVGMRLCCGWALEFSYLGLYPGSESAAVVEPDPNAFLTLPGNLFGNAFVDFDSALVTLTTGLQGVEANMPFGPGCCDSCCCGDGIGCDCGDPCCCGDKVGRESIQWFAGLRYINLHERLDIATQRMIAGGVEEGVYNVRTTNNLYGVQVGARERHEPNRFGCEATCKIGIFVNDAKQEQTVTDFPDFPLRPTVSARSGGLAVVGETNLTALYRLTNVWNLRAGYSVIWIEGVALAIDQLDFNFATAPSGDQLHNDGGLLLQGINIGLEAGW